MQQGTYPGLRLLSKTVSLAPALASTRRADIFSFHKIQGSRPDASRAPATPLTGQRRWRLHRSHPLPAALTNQTEAAPTSVPTTAPGCVCIENVKFEDGVYTVQGRLDCTASPDLVFQVLTDYHALPRVFHNVLEVEVMEVEGQKQLVQTCKWAFLVFSGTFRTSLSVLEEPAARRLAFHLIQSSFMRQFVGRWDIAPAATPPHSPQITNATVASALASPAPFLSERPASASATASSRTSSSSEAVGKPSAGGRGGSVIRHTLSVRPSVAPPAALSHYTSQIFSSQVERVLHDLRGELQRRLAAQQQQAQQQ